MKSTGENCLIEFDLFSDFAKNIDLDKIEPFTMISVEDHERGRMISELVWDGEKKYMERKGDEEKHIWSSSTLYSKELRQKRREIFDAVDLENGPEVLRFHQEEGRELGEENRFMMKRNGGLQTISTTQVLRRSGQTSIAYFNYVTGEQTITDYA